MFVKIGAKAESDFSRPIDLMSDCHRRIEQFLGMLSRVAAVGPSGTLDEEQRRALRAALDYFKTAAPRHTADEEESLFPRMRQSDDPRTREALAKVEALEADHREADRMHAEVESLGRRWLDEGRLTPDEVRRFGEIVARLGELYQRHIAVEDGEVFPLAKQVLGAADLKGVGAEMAGRRGVRGG